MMVSAFLDAEFAAIDAVLARSEAAIEEAKRPKPGMCLQVLQHAPWLGRLLAAAVLRQSVSPRQRISLPSISGASIATVKPGCAPSPMV